MYMRQITCQIELNFNLPHFFYLFYLFILILFFYFFAHCLQVCLGIAAFLIPDLCEEEGKCGKGEKTSLVLYVHGGMWFLLLLVHLYLYYEHRRSLLHGYFTFHLETSTLRRAPLFINSGGNICVQQNL
jgi:hypothetical protein